jgi:hypothetical protein
MGGLRDQLGRKPCNEACRVVVSFSIEVRTKLLGAWTIGLRKDAFGMPKRPS